VQFGSYDIHLDTIRIHPVLDDPRVPLAFTHFVVYHEMLHAALGVREGPGGRCIHHGADFRERERAFPLYAEAIRWERENLDKILTLASGRKRRWTPGGVQQAIFESASLL
jgi:hypothetical protein